MALEQLLAQRAQLDELIALYEANNLLRAQALSAALTIEQLEAKIAKLEAPIVRPPLLVDPAFTSDRCWWYGRLRTAITHQGTSIRSAAATGIPSAIGRDVRGYVSALVWALMDTGDAALIDEVVGVMNALRSRGELLVILDLDRAMLTPLYALVAYVLHVNAHPDAAYWRERAEAACANGVPKDDLMHPYAASLETAWYMWLLTGDARFRADAETRRAELVKSITITEDGRATWYHRPSTWRGKAGDTENPLTTYVRYTVQSLAMLDRLGMNVVPMAAVAKTVINIVRTDGTTANFIDGTGVDTGKLTGSNWWLAVRADESGALRVLAAAVAPANQIFIPAAMVGV